MENKTHINNRLSEQLPSHAPDPETWQRLSAKLDAFDAESALQDRLQDLPVHFPDKGTWRIISRRLTRIAYYKTGVRVALSAAAGLLLFFTVSRISDQFQVSTSTIPQVALQEKLINSSEKTHPATPVISEETISQKSNNSSGDKPSVKNATAYSDVTTNQAGWVENQTEIVKPANYNEVNVIQKSIPDEAISVTETSESELALALEIPVLSENASNPITKNTSIHDGILPVKETIKADIETRSILFQKEQNPVTTVPSVKLNSPKKPDVDKKANHFALAMGYLPENINNGTNTSLFHNVDFTASYNKEKVRVNTSLGMAYNEEQIEFDMYYDINTPVTAMGPGGKLDTLSYEVANLESEYMGTEKHKYVTYNLGFGRKLFSVGKFSTWINAGAGFGIKLNEPDLITSTANSIKGQYNAVIVRVSSSKPVYNDVNINFVTGIDFNYKILTRLSISFAPISRWYFKPVLSLDNQPTDELTLGFRTGMKFDF